MGNADKTVTPVFGVVLLAQCRFECDPEVVEAYLVVKRDVARQVYVGDRKCEAITTGFGPEPVGQLAVGFKTRNTVPVNE